MMAATSSRKDLIGLVDMGSNGIRFSITDLSPPTARIMPTLWQDRCGISLYDAQYTTGSQGPIPDSITRAVIIALLRFKTVCQDFAVPDSSIRIIATEATRTAANSQEYRQAIEKATGWKVEMLPKEEEGRIGALGVASSFSSITGLAMDLGGGSIQLSWIEMLNGVVSINPEKIVSLPYGAAAMKRLLEEAESQGRPAVDMLSQTLSQDLRTAIANLNIPTTPSLKLYLSGGGFRGWGYLLMAAHTISPYPISLINGFEVSRSTFLSLAQNTNQPPQPQSSQATTPESSTFRISSRRQTQIPAISFLVTTLSLLLPTLQTIHFAQGGVREGLLYSSLPPSTQAISPLEAATLPHAPASVPVLLSLLRSGIPTPPPHSTTSQPPFLSSPSFLTAVIHLLYYHASHPQDILPSAALRATTTGILASSHGLLHSDRALLALVLYARWGAELPPGDIPFFNNLQQLVGSEQAWWAKYLGAVARAVGEVYPAGAVREGEERVKWRAAWGEKKGESVVDVGVIGVGAGGEWIEGWEKVGKKKNWVGGFGVKVRVSVEGEGV